MDSSLNILLGLGNGSGKVRDLRGGYFCSSVSREGGFKWAELIEDDEEERKEMKGKERGGGYGMDWGFGRVICGYLYGIIWISFAVGKCTLLVKMHGTLGARSLFA